MSDTLKDLSRRTLTAGDRYLALLAIVLLGYALMGKGFAYIGFPPLYVGEIAFLTGIVVFVRSGVLVASLATLPSLVLAATDDLGPGANGPVRGRVRVRCPARQRRHPVWRLCVYRHWAVAGGCAQDRYRASLLQRVAGELSRNTRGILAHQVLGRLHPEIVRSERADRRDQSELRSERIWREPRSSS